MSHCIQVFTLRPYQFHGRFISEELVPIPGYDNRFKRLDFNDLGEGVFVTIRNPKTVPPSMLRPEGISMDAAGNPTNEAQAERAMYKVLANLVRDWYVFDATSDEDEQPVLGLPATADSVEKLPLEIINRIASELALATNPS